MHRLPSLSLLVSTLIPPDSIFKPHRSSLILSCFFLLQFPDFSPCFSAPFHAQQGPLTANLVQAVQTKLRETKLREKSDSFTTGKGGSAAGDRTGFGWSIALLRQRILPALGSAALILALSRGGGGSGNQVRSNAGATVRQVDIWRHSLFFEHLSHGSHLLSPITLLLSFTLFLLSYSLPL